jgi:hypothetical protein
LIPIRTMASEMASSADTRQLLCRTQPQRLADGFNLGEELRHRRLSRLRASARFRSFVSGPSRPDTHPQAPKRRAWEALTQTHFTHVDGSLSEQVRAHGAQPSGAPFWRTPWHRRSRR